MEELDKNRIIECIDLIINTRENVTEEIIKLSSGGTITFTLLEGSYIKVKCEL